MIDEAMLVRLRLIMQAVDVDCDIHKLLPLAKAIWEQAQLEERYECVKVCNDLAEKGWPDNPEYGSYGEFSDCVKHIKERPTE